jgi:hypothetical protein
MNDTTLPEILLAGRRARGALLWGRGGAGRDVKNGRFRHGGNLSPLVVVTVAAHYWSEDRA